MRGRLKLLAFGLAWTTGRHRSPLVRPDKSAWRVVPSHPRPHVPGANSQEDPTVTWTRITDPETVSGLLPAWLGRRMIGLRGAFGLLLTTGDVLRLTSIAAAHQSSRGVILLDVLLDLAGVPEGADMAWRQKHFLGAPVPGASVATVNLAHVVAAVEFTVAEMAVNPGDDNVPFSDAISDDPEPLLTEAVGKAAD